MTEEIRVADQEELCRKLLDMEPDSGLDFVIESGEVIGEQDINSMYESLSEDRPEVYFSLVSMTSLDGKTAGLSALCTSV